MSYYSTNVTYEAFYADDLILEKEERICYARLEDHIVDKINIYNTDTVDPDLREQVLQKLSKIVNIVWDKETITLYPRDPRNYYKTINELTVLRILHDNLDSDDMGQDIKRSLPLYVAYEKHDDPFTNYVDFWKNQEFFYDYYYNSNHWFWSSSYIEKIDLKKANMDYFNRNLKMLNHQF